MRQVVDNNSTLTFLYDGLIGGFVCCGELKEAKAWR